ncbi:class I SAM-dependent methyltransferase [Candidatus Woesearchaeota archaeon]|nr:class I SAM-dependent methyltransferase [Candidatus Woesearchaeota archaeon]
MDIQKLKEKIFSSKDESLKKQFEQDNMMDQFMDKLKEINYNESSDTNSLLDIAKKIEHMSDWPQNPEKFWDLEAAFWNRRIDNKTKNIIINELNKNISGKTLNIGSGSFPYINSINIDISYEMLYWNPSENKIQADALFLPFKDKSFDSAIAVFVANYIKDLADFIQELKRVLKKDSNLIFVQAKNINKLHQLAENKNFSVQKLSGLLRNNGFSVRQLEKENLVFLRCKKVC